MLVRMALVSLHLIAWTVGGPILASASILLIYITNGGLTSAIYNEVLQFFVICAALIPLTLVALHSVGGWNGLEHRIKELPALGNAGLHAWKGLGVHHPTNPLKANWIGVVFGLGFVVSFGYWTTNFAEVQRALSARNLSAARRTPLIAAYPKTFMPFIIILPGLIAVATIHGLGVGKSLSLQYNTAIPNLINYIQTLFSIFNVPLFTTFIVAMIWKRATAMGGFWSLVAGTATAYGVNRLAAYHVIFHFGSALSASFWQSIWAFIVGTVVLIGVSLVTKPKPEEELRGLVWGLTRKEEREVDADPRDRLWWRSPVLLGGVIIAVVVALNIIFI